MTDKIQTIKDIRIYFTKELSNIYPDTEISALATIIIRTLFDMKKLHQFAMPEQPVSGKDAARIVSICKELKTGKPVQYILGETNFYNCSIKVNNYTLIPRPETEELVDLIIKENKGFRGSITDIGTGSGCIAIALAVNLPGAEITATDISEGALQTAAQNAVLNNARVRFIKSDILANDGNMPEKAGIIVSNPPYIRELEREYMSANVLNFEPGSALFVPDSDPLLYYRNILERIKNVLVAGGKIYFEINEAMGKQMKELLEEYGYMNVQVISDLNGKDRMTKAVRNG